MNCAICGSNIFCAELKSLGGYLCTNHHLQCEECNKPLDGFCQLCGASTKLFKIKWDLPTSLPEHPQSIPQSRSNFPQQLSKEMETQSILSRENLTMKTSEESIAQNVEDFCNAKAYDDEENNLFTEQLLVPTDNSASLVDCSGNQNLSKSFNTDKVSKTEVNKPSITCEECNELSRENQFLFKSNRNDNDVINTSEIRFMDSTETSQKSSYKIEQLNGLTAAAIKDFEFGNCVTKSEIVKTYLENYSATAACASPANTCEYHPLCHFNFNKAKEKLGIEVKNVSVSTESDPSLESSLYAKVKNIDNLRARKYFVMQAVGVASALEDEKHCSDCQKHSCMDVRMQKILETLKEDTSIKVNKFGEKADLVKLPTKISAPVRKLDEVEKLDGTKKDTNSDLMGHLLNTYRAYYNPPSPLLAPVINLHLLPQCQTAQQEPPSQQFQSVPCSKSLAKQLLLTQAKFPKVETVPAFKLNISRSPIQCPEHNCQRMIFVSDFNKHLELDHSHLPMERIASLQCKNFFLDTRLLRHGASKCHLLYLMRDKIIGLGNNEYKNLIPLMVMTTRISLNEMCGNRNQQSSPGDYFLIWVTGIAADNLSISVSLTVWSRSGRAPLCHVVYAGQMYSVRNSQHAVDVWQSGRMLLLSPQEIAALTNDGKDMLNLQLIVH